jgi:hypothetical protein
MYTGDKSSFLASYLDDRRAEEVKVLSRLAPFIARTPNKLWVLNLITKQDLWWPSREDVKSHYVSGPYGSVLSAATAPLGTDVRTEFVFGSLVTDNFKTGRNEELAKVASGYQQQAQVDSIKQLWTTLRALKQWEQQ